MVVMKNGCGLLGLGTLKLLYLKNKWINWADFLHADTKLCKLKVTLIIIGWLQSEIGKALKIVGLLSQVYLTNDLMNWADWLNYFCMVIVTEYSTLLCAFGI